MATSAKLIGGSGVRTGSAISYNVPSSGGISVDSSVSQSSLPSYIDQILSQSEQNNAWSAKQAEIQRDWSASEAEKLRQFNSDEAAKNRDWQKYMSDTAHQREIADLKAAGLNPVLSAMGGNGASVTSGATASGSMPSGTKGDTDTSANSAIVSLLGSFLQAQTQLQAMNTNAITNLAVADKYTAMQKFASELSSDTSKYVAGLGSSTSRWVAALQSETQLKSSNISAMASMYATDQHLAGTKYAADKSAAASQIAASIHAAAQKYGYDVQSMTSKEIAAFNAEVNKDLKQMDIDASFDLKEAFPNSILGTAQSAFGQITGGTGIGSLGDLISDMFGSSNGFDNTRGSFGSARGGFGSSRGGFGSSR